jgi:hypothetical protein
MSMHTRLATLLVLLGALAAGCGGDNPLREVAQGIVAAAATARSVSLAIGAVGGNAAACVQVATPCTTYPCQTSAAIQVGAACSMPLGAADSGVVNVMGSWSSVSDATLTMQFVNVKESVNPDAIALAQVTQVTGTRSGNITTVTYSGSNAGARAGLSGTAVGGSSSWTVDVDDKGTADPGDDVLTVKASSAAAGAGLGVSAKTMTLAGVTIDPSCALNPIAGTGNITEVQTLIPKIQDISFHAACDGKGSVNNSAYAFDASP